MSLIQFDSKLSKQPSSNARLRDKWTSFSVLSQRGLTVLGGITKDVSIGGRGWQGNGSTKGAYVNASMSIAAAGGGETDSLLIGVIFSSTVTTDGTLVSFGVSTNTTGGYFQITHSGGALSIAADDAANVSGVISPATFGFNDGLVHTAVALLRTRSDGRYQGLWVDGKFFASGTSGVFHATTFDRIAVACLRRNATSSFLPAGRYVYEAFYGKGFSADEAQNLSARRWDAFYAPKRIWVPVSAGGDVSLALSGAAATSAAGNTSAGISTALTGVSSTAATGTLAASISAALTGVSSTAATGTLATATSVALSGISSTSAAGTLATATSVALSGVSSTAAAGALSAGGDASAAVTGQAASTAQGTLGVTVSGAAALSGASVAASAGTLSAGISTALTGASAAVSTGSLVAGGDVSVTIAGQAVSTAQGTVGVTATGAATVALTGAAAVIAAGNIFVVAPAVGWTPVDDSDPNAWIPVDDSNAALWV